MKKGIVILTLSLLCSPSVAFLSDAVAGGESPFEFLSENKATFNDVFHGTGPDKSIRIQGRLHLPKSSAAKIPAAIILPGAGGFDQDDDLAIVKAVNEIGVAALAFDPNKARNISEWLVAARTISDAMRVCDAFAALKALSTHPGIDGERIAVIGRSRGGLVALLAASERIRHSLLGNELKFAAHIGLYPGCYVQLKDPELTGAPILMLLAEKDNVTPARECLEYAERIRSAGHSIKETTYKGAAHGFTKSALARRTVKVRGLPDNTKCTDRHLLLQGDGSWHFPHANKVFDTQPWYLDLRTDCSRPNQGVVGDPTGVRQRSHKDIQAFLREVFVLQ